jgi:hypothetical protein
LKVLLGAIAPAAVELSLDDAGRELDDAVGGRERVCFNIGYTAGLDDDVGDFERAMISRADEEAIGAGREVGKIELAVAIGERGSAEFRDGNFDVGGGDGVGREEAALDRTGGGGGAGDDEGALRGAAGVEAGGLKESREGGVGFEAAVDGGGPDLAEIVGREEDVDAGLLGKREKGVGGGLGGDVERDGSGAGEEREKKEKGEEMAGPPEEELIAKGQEEG